MAGDGRRPADRASALDQGPHRRQRRALHLRLAHARRFRCARRRARLRAREGARRRDRRQDHHDRVRLQGLERQPAHRRHPQSVESGQDHAAARRPAPAPASRPASRRSRSAPTAAARSASRPRSAACSGSRRSSAGCRCFRPRRRRRSPMSGRWRARCATRRCCSPRFRASMRAIRRASPPMCPTISAPASARPRACASHGARRSAMPGRPPRWPRSPARPRALFEQLGCTVELVEKVFDDPIALWMAEFYAGVGTRLKKPLAEQRDLIDPAVAEVLETALDQTIDQYYARVFARYEFREKVRAFFERYDLLMTPTTPTPAFDLGRDLPARVRRREHRRLGRLYLSGQPLRPAGRLGAVRVHARRPAGRPAHRVEGAARDRHLARRRRLRGGAAVGGHEAADRRAAARRAMNGSDCKPGQHDAKFEQTEVAMTGTALGMRFAAAVVAASLGLCSPPARRSRSRSALPAR